MNNKVNIIDAVWEKRNLGVSVSEVNISKDASKFQTKNQKIIT